MSAKVLLGFRTRCTPVVFMSLNAGPIESGHYPVECFVSHVLWMYGGVFPARGWPQVEAPSRGPAVHSNISRPAESRWEPL